ncbi:hypothetical protein [Saccharothrix sp. HUAS TT1]|uniref:hypothetical protein n=1 Tax=unclassified Saccharothrix TaxID=2593673 RepID=UPI00345BBBCF
MTHLTTPGAPALDVPAITPATDPAQALGTVVDLVRDHGELFAGRYHDGDTGRVGLALPKVVLDMVDAVRDQRPDLPEVVELVALLDEHRENDAVEMALDVLLPALQRVLAALHAEAAPAEPAGPVDVADDAGRDEAVVEAAARLLLDYVAGDGAHVTDPGARCRAMALLLADAGLLADPDPASHSETVTVRRRDGRLTTVPRGPARPYRPVPRTAEQGTPGPRLRVAPEPQS